MPELTSEFLLEGFLTYFVFLFSTVLHEASHALSARVLGDDTAADEGLVTVSPVPHIQREPLGMVLVPVIGMFSGFMFGWGSAPYDPVWAARYPRRSALVALAGPMANLTIAVCAYLLILIGAQLGIFGFIYEISFASLVAPEQEWASGLAMLLSVAVTMNLFLALFNLLPVPPLDGSSVIALLLPNKYVGMVEEFRTNSTYQMIGLLVVLALGAKIVLPILSRIIWILF